MGKKEAIEESGNVDKGERHTPHTTQEEKKFIRELGSYSDHTKDEGELRANPAQRLTLLLKYRNGLYLRDKAKCPFDMTEVMEYVEKQIKIEENKL